MTGWLYRGRPARERARGQGTIWAASRFGGALAPLLLVPLEAVFGWRVVFVALGIIGLAWAVAWRFWYHDRPADQPGITPEEVAEIGDDGAGGHSGTPRSEEHTSELQSLMRISYAVFCLKKKTNQNNRYNICSNSP